MTPLERQFALRKKGLTQKRVAEEIGVSQVSVSDVILGRRVSDRVMRGIAAAIGRDVRMVFPQYYLQPPRRKTSKVSSAA